MVPKAAAVRRIEPRLAASDMRSIARIRIVGDGGGADGGVVGSVTVVEDEEATVEGWVRRER